MQVWGVVDAHRPISALEKKVMETEFATMGVALRQAGAVLEAAAKVELTKAGRHKKGTATPSVAPAAPSIITGSLRASIKTGKPIKVGFGSYKVEVGPKIIYGRAQELGYEAGNLPARPYMAPAFEASKAEIVKVYQKVWGSSLR